MSTLDRQEIFLRWWVHQLRVLDCDPAIWAMKYIINRLELNTEQRFWFSWIYANTYQLPTAWVIFNEFPDFENAPADRIDAWCKTNRDRLPYQKDMKWLRGCLGETFSSYKLNIGFQTQEAFWDKLTQSTPTINFTSCWVTVLEHFHKFGRYAAWFYLQTLKEVCGLNVEPTCLMLNFDSSATHRAGLCLALGRDDWAAKGTKFDSKMLRELDDGAADLLSRVKAFPELDELPIRPDYFSMETSLCSFKKLFRHKQGRYLGFYLDRFAEDIIKTAACDWPGINWQLLWDARNECLLPELNNLEVDKSKFDLFLDTGHFTDNKPLLAKLDTWFTQHNLL